MSAAFTQIWCVDFEFGAPDGERPTPRCMVARELHSGRVVRAWSDELATMKAPPFPIDGSALFVAFYSSAEFGCFLALDWPMPAHVLDLFAEFRNATNGLPTACGAGLVGALSHYGLDVMDAAEKETMRALALRGEPYTPEERRALITYCEADVDALARLYAAMVPSIDMPRALLRGRYMIAAARMEWTGIPIDVQAHAAIKENWTTIKAGLIAKVDADYGVYDGPTFKVDRFADYLIRHGIAWPRTATDRLALDDDTFKAMAALHPALSALRELRKSLAELREINIAVGSDGRNRCLLSAFRSKTGRNQPSSARFIYGAPAWLRHLIRPEPGHGLAYIDIGQEEFGIAAALSGDPAMMAAYASGDPYLAFAKQAGAVPPDGTRETHGPIREQFKACCLAVMYGMGEVALAARIGQSPAAARDLLRAHRSTYPKFWRWSEAAIDAATLRGSLVTTFGWTVRAGTEPNPRSLANFPMQANGAEILRLACIAATETGIQVCAPVHDALLIESPLDRLDADVAQARDLMARASSVVLGGPALRSDAKIIRHPDRFTDPRGVALWDHVAAILTSLRHKNDVCTGATLPVHGRTGAPSHIYNLLYYKEGPPDGRGQFGYDRPAETPPHESPTTPQGGREILARPDPVAVAGEGRDAAREVASRGRGGVAVGGTEEAPDHQSEPNRLTPVGCVAIRGGPGAEGTGGRRTGDGDASAGPGTDRHVAGLSEGTTDLTDPFDFPGAPCADPRSRPLPPRLASLFAGARNDDHRAALCDAFEERAAILEFDAGFSRALAELLAMRELRNRRRAMELDGICEQCGRPGIRADVDPHNAPACCPACGRPVRDAVATGTRQPRRQDVGPELFADGVACHDVAPA